MAFPAIAALVAAETVTATMVLAAATEVGIAMTVVGAVTGSKDLMKIGGVLGLVGGIGGMVAGAAGAATGAAAEGAAEVALSEAATSTALDQASQEALNFAGGDAAMQASQQAGIQSMEQAAGQGIDSTPVAPQVMPEPTPLAPAAQTPTTPEVSQPTLEAKAPEGVSAPQTPAGAEAPADVSTPYSNPTDQRLANNLQRSPGNPALPSDSSDSFFGKFSAWAEKNKTLFNGGMQLVGGALKGMNERDMWDQKMGLQRDQWNRANSVGSYAPRGIVGGAA